MSASTRSAATSRPAFLIRESWALKGDSVASLLANENAGPTPGDPLAFAPRNGEVGERPTPFRRPALAAFRQARPAIGNKCMGKTGSERGPGARSCSGSCGMVPGTGPSSGSTGGEPGSCSPGTSWSGRWGLCKCRWDMVMASEGMVDQGQAGSLSRAERRRVVVVLPGQWLGHRDIYRCQRWLPGSVRFIRRRIDQGGARWREDRRCRRDPRIGHSARQWARFGRQRLVGDGCRVGGRRLVAGGQQ